ncbi:MAG TPA: hypothetical protein VMH86_07425 [Rhizomicrobium sp.]|nr:hypothetical protein [Rhizomicrobium sp.]
MLRSVVLGIGALALAGGIIALFTGGIPAGFVFGCWGALIAAGIVWERVVYKPIEPRPPLGNWVRTAERFIDEESGGPVTVWLDPQTGERKYVRD